MTGKIKMYNENKGYGFIFGEDNCDYFFHISQIKSADDISRGMRVEFIPGSSEKGKVAKNVIVLQNQNRRPAFVQLADNRIKLNNIKNYGIAKSRVLYLKVYEQVETSIMYRLLSYKIDYVWKGRTIQFDQQSYLDAVTRYNIKKYGNTGCPSNAFFVSANNIDHWLSFLVGNRRLEILKNGKIELIDCDIDPISLARGKSSLDMTKDDLIVKERRYLYISTYQGDNFTFFEDEASFNIDEKCKELDKYMM